jgi:hypothetical protein
MDLLKFHIDCLVLLFNRWHDAVHLLADYFLRFGLGKTGYCLLLSSPLIADVPICQQSVPISAVVVVVMVVV